LNRDQLQSLYVSYGFAVHRRCVRILGSKADADDVVQEVFMRALKYGERFDGTNALGWLYRISDTQCFEVLKKKKRQPILSVVNTDEMHSSCAEAQVDDPIIGPMVQKLMAAADPKDTRIALLYFVDGMTQDEVAEEIPCSRKTVKKRLARFRELAKRLGSSLVTLIIFGGIR
jgi:RNA polymerase sigma-70 factor (ECF subfamily)